MKNIFFLILLIIPLLSISQDLTINYDFPKKIQTGKEFIVNVEIKKYDLTSFAQYKQVLPEGFTVKNIINNDANFSFENNIVTYSWAKLDKYSLLQISYSVLPDSSVTDNFETKGQFSYTVNNSRGVIYTSETKVFVNDKITDIIEVPKNIEIVEIKTDTVKQVVEEINCDVKISRNIKIINQNEITVELVINKCNYSGMAIIQEIIPELYTVNFIDFEDIKFQFDSGVLTVNISKMPENNNLFTINYTLKKDLLIIEYPSLSGIYKFIKKDVLQNIPISDGTKEGELYKEEVKTEQIVPEIKEEIIIKEEVKNDNGENDIIKFLNE